jgi:hypothetical protein
MTVEGYGQMFYWFVESQGNPSADPVVLWLNGGKKEIHSPFFECSSTHNYTLKDLDAVAWKVY